MGKRAITYTEKDYDKHLGLKLNFDMWLVVLYLLRPYILMLSTFSMGRGGGKGGGISGLRDMVYPDNFSLILGILASMPVFLFLYAWIRRSPGASSGIVKLWNRGAWILGTSAVLNILIVFVPVVAGMSQTVGQGGWIQVGIAAFILFYLATSRRVRDTFADFPQAAEPG